MDIFGFAPSTVFGFWLVVMRISMVLFLLPFFSGMGVPNPVKAAASLVLALAIWPHAMLPGDLMPGNMWGIMIMLFGEVLLGLVLSICVHILFAAVQTAGSLAGFQMGFSMINVVDPMSGSQETVTAHFFYMITILTFLTLDGHLMLLSAVGESFKLIPPGHLLFAPALTRDIFAFSSQIFVLSIKMCAPVIVALFLVDLALGLVSRVAPQMNVLVFGFPFKIAVGFLFLGMIFTLLARFVGGYLVDMQQILAFVLRQGAPAGP